MNPLETLRSRILKRPVPVPYIVHIPRHHVTTSQIMAAALDFQGGPTDPRATTPGYIHLTDGCGNCHPIVVINEKVVLEQMGSKFRPRGPIQITEDIHEASGCTERVAYEVYAK